MAGSLPKTKLAQYVAAPESMKSDTHYPIFQAGIHHGYTSAMKVALSFLEHDLIGAEDRPAPGSAEYDAILAVTRKLAQRLRDAREVESGK